MSTELKDAVKAENKLISLTNMSISTDLRATKAEKEAVMLKLEAKQEAKEEKGKTRRDTGRHPQVVMPYRVNIAYYSRNNFNLG